MLLIQCNQCRAQTFTEDGSHPGAALACGCCPQDHDHDAAANACPGAGLGHGDVPCPSGPQCLVVTPAGEECPGGHCGPGVAGCQVCRPVTVTLLPGSAPVAPLVIGA